MVSDVGVIQAHFFNKTDIKPPVFDLPLLPPEVLGRLHIVQDLHALEGYECIQSNGFTRYLLYPPEGIELFDISEPCNRVALQTELFCVLEGSATMNVDGDEHQLFPGQAVRISKGSRIFFTGFMRYGCRVLFVGLDAPHSKQAEHNHSVLVDEPASKAVESKPSEPEMAYFKDKALNGSNAVYDLIAGKSVGGRYNISIMDIVVPRTQKHYHEFETERRIVLAGNVDVEIGDSHYQLTKGQMVRVSPPVPHKYTSSDGESTIRLLAINMPAYDAKNVILVTTDAL